MTAKNSRKLKVAVVAPLSNDHVVVRVVKSDRPEEVGTLASIIRQQPNVPFQPDGEFGSFKPISDGLMEFKPYQPSEKIQVEDRTKRKGPSKVNSNAFRSGWAETFGGGLKN